MRICVPKRNRKTRKETRTRLRKLSDCSIMCVSIVNNPDLLLSISTAPDFQFMFASPDPIFSDALKPKKWYNMLCLLCPIYPSQAVS